MPSRGWCRTVVVGVFVFACAALLPGSSLATGQDAESLIRAAKQRLTGPELPAVVSRVAVVYPDTAAAANKLIGPVVLDVIIDTSGVPTSVTAVDGHDLLRQVAIDAVRQWRFAPTRSPKPFLLGVIVAPREAALSQSTATPIVVTRTEQPPRKVANANAWYPPDAAKARIQGVIIVETRIGADGVIDYVRILRSIPPLDVAALMAVAQWRFEPWQVNGTPSPVQMDAIVNFMLK